MTAPRAEVTFDAIHQYGGVVLGEHLGQLFTIAWIVMVSAMMLRSTIFRPWLGWFGLFAAAVYSIAQLELIATVIDDFPNWSKQASSDHSCGSPGCSSSVFRLVTTKTFPTSASR